MTTSVYLRYRAAAVILLLGVVLPVLFWARDVSLATLFSSSYNALSTISQVSGLVGLSLFSLNLLLSGRYASIDSFFFGLDRAYRAHRLTGLIGFSLMLLHIASVTIRAATGSVSEVATLWLSFDDPALMFGRLSFAGFLIIILLTLFARLPYHWLKKNHQALGLFLLFGGFHAYLIPSDLSVNEPLRLYILGLAGIAVLSYVWRTLLKQWLVPRRRFTIKAVNRLTRDITEVVMQPKDNQQVLFTPGQFNFYTFLQPGFLKEDHPFSITAGTGEGQLRLSAKALGDFTSKMPHLEAGTEVIVQGPFGGFSYRHGSPKQVWIAGGIGITPFISMVRSLHTADHKNLFTIDLYYSMQSRADAVYVDELEQIAAELPNFSVYLWSTNERGYLTAAAIAKQTSLIDRDIYLCGPPSLIEALSKQLQQEKVSRHRIFSERFKLL